MEDSAAVTGVFVAAGALGITHWTGNTIYDAIGSISIGGTYLAMSLDYSSQYSVHAFIVCSLAGCCGPFPHPKKQ